jgi:hypothetical protein
MIVHPAISTQGLNLKDAEKLSEQVKGVIASRFVPAL